MKKASRREVRDIFLGSASFGIGTSVLIISSLLLTQSLCKHKGESGPLYQRIYGWPFQNSNWMKSSIPIIVVSSFGIVLGSVQILSSLVLILVNKKYRIFGHIIWLGSHLLIFIFNIICFSLAISVRSHEHKESALFWQNYQFRSQIIHNIEGHAYCFVLILNSIFILITVSTTAPSLYFLYEDKPIYLPESSY